MNIVHLFALAYPRLRGPVAMRIIQRPGCAGGLRGVLSVERDRDLFDCSPYWQVSVGQLGKRRTEWSPLQWWQAGELAAEAIGNVGVGPLHNLSTRLAYRLIRRCSIEELRFYRPSPRHAIDRRFPIDLSPVLTPVVFPSSLRASVPASLPPEPIQQLIDAARATAEALWLLSQGDRIEIYLPDLRLGDLGGQVFFRGGKFAGYERPGERITQIPEGWVRIGKAIQQCPDGHIGVAVDPRASRELCAQLLSPLQTALARMPASQTNWEARTHTTGP